MANGPLGGFMPTPAAPAQPPPIKLDTTASSRGSFNNFLKSMNGATSLNPPSMAPFVGATTPTLAPASNIDIFNQPVAMMQFGGDPMDAAFSDFAGFSDSSDPFGGGDTSIDDVGSESESDPIDLSSATIQAGTRDVPLNVFADDAASVDSGGVNVGLETGGGFSLGTKPQLPGDRFTRFESVPFALRGIGRDFKTKLDNSGDDGLTVASYFNTYNPESSNADRIAEFKSLTGKSGDDKLSISDMPNIMNIQSKYEAGIRNVQPAVLQAAVKSVPIDDETQVRNIFGDVGVSGLGAGDPRLGIDLFETVTNQAFTPAMAGLPTVTSRFNQTKPKSDLEQLRDAVALTIKQTTRPQSNAERGLQQNQAIQQGFNLGPLTFDDDLANFRANERDTSQRIGPPQMPDTVFDIDTRPRGPVDTVFDIDTRSRGPVDTVFDIDTTTRRTTADDTDPREDTLGVLPAQTIADIERLSNVPVGQRKAGPGSDPTFFQGLGFPSFFDGIERFSRDKMAAELATGKVPEDRIVRNDSGRVVAIKDRFGRTVEGVDPNEPIGSSDDNQEPIIRKPIAPVVEEPKADVKPPPNIIGGTDPIVTLPVERPTVVTSPFAPSSANISPVTFDTGELNKLIELLTGVPAKPVVAKQEGGLVSAVDEFLASGS